MSSRNATALAISILFHALLLGAMALYRISLTADAPVVSVETIFSEERTTQEISQDLDIDTTVSTTLAVQAGGSVTTDIGAAAAEPVAQTKIETSEALQNPDVRVATIGDISIPGAGTLNVDLGEGEVSGETGARVEGYGAAMHRLTQELLRMMRVQPVTVVWLFDASNSLKDDREEIRENFHKIYDELRIAERQRRETAQEKRALAPLETMVCSFGADVFKLLGKPESNIDAIKSAINAVRDDESGVEKTFSAIEAVVDEYGPQTARADRKLAVIVVTDETGEDDEKLEAVISKCQRFKIPVYFLGREAIFGYPYARVRWTDPEFGLPHWIRVDRGPETAFPECLQYDGFHGRHDAASSGFGPYAQVRLSKESGGIFFLLSTQEKNLAGSAARLQRKFDDLAMKEYEPLLLSRREYEAHRDQSEFRRTIWQVIVALNPHLDGQLNLNSGAYPLDFDEFQQAGRAQFDRALRSMAKLNEGIRRLEAIEPLRAREREARWRAAFDLCYAQLLAYRVRQFQFLLALDKHAKDRPKPKDPKHNRWHMHHAKTLLEPDERQTAATKVDPEEVHRQRKRAIEMYRVVLEEHPNTPWAQRARQEQRWSFGIGFHSYFHNPLYSDPEYRARVKVPNF